MKHKLFLPVAALLCTLTAISAYGQSAQPPAAQGEAQSVPERVADLKKSLAQSNAALKSYEWIETTTVSVKGEVKSTTQMKCYHGADGKVQKVAVAPTPEPEKKRGIRGKIIENKKEELSEYMKQAVALVHQYIPPNPDAIQKVKDAGKVSVAVLEPGKRVRIDMKDYITPGDELKIELTLTNNHLAGISVATLLDDKATKSDKKDPVTLAVKMGTLEDGSTYTSESTLEAKAKDLKVVITNSGYRKVVK
jgi:hypothetical protein